MYLYRLLIFVFSLTLSVSTQAQSNQPIGGHFGVKVGAGITNLSVSGITANVPKQALQPHLGIMYRYRYNKFVFQPEALIAIKGSTFKVERLGTTTTTKVARAGQATPRCLTPTTAYGGGNSPAWLLTWKATTSSALCSMP